MFVIYVKAYTLRNKEIGNLFSFLKARMTFYKMA